MDPVLIKLSAEAAHFVRILRSLEYLHPPIDTMLHRKLLHSFAHNDVIELKDVKRCMAEILFEHKDKLPERIQGFVQKDWSMLFG